MVSLVLSEYLNIFYLPYNGLVRKLTWTQVTEIEISRYTICRHWCSNHLKVSCWSLKNRSHGSISNIFGVWVTWTDMVPDLSRPLGETLRKGVEGMYVRACRKRGLAAPLFPFCYSRKTMASEPPSTAPRGLRQETSRDRNYSYNIFFTGPTEPVRFFFISSFYISVTLTLDI